MQTADKNKIPITVELQDNYSYMPVGVIIILAMAAVVLILLLIRIYKKMKANPKPIQVKELSVDKLAQLKNKYIGMLEGIARRHSQGELDDRMAYQELSKVIRHFVHGVTGVKVQNYTLDEIGKANIPSLYYLIAECYVPEFDIEGKGNIYETINKARKVIEEWN